MSDLLIKETNHRIDERLTEFYESIKDVKTATEINGGYVVHMRE